MIGRLRGALLEYDEPVALVDVGGVGYEVEVTATAAAMLTARPERVELYTHFIARDDAQLLYGFASQAERTLFRSLIKVSGIGPKLGLALLSAVAPQQFANAIAGGDTAALIRVPGIGKRTAERLIVELRDRVTELGAPAARGGGAVQEAVLALVALGYRESAAARVVAEAADSEADGADVEALVREALKRLST